MILVLVKAIAFFALQQSRTQKAMALDHGIFLFRVVVYRCKYI